MATMKQMYFSLINSKLEYGISLWGSTYKSNLASIKVLQKKFVRIITNSNFHEPSFPLFVNNNILPVRHLYVFKVLSIFYKISGNTGPTIDYSHDYPTRQAVNSCVRLPKPYCSLFQKSFVYLSFKFFNLLPNDIKILNSHLLFNKKLKPWILAKNNEEIENFYLITL